MMHSVFLRAVIFSNIFMNYSEGDEVIDETWAGKKDSL